MSYRIVLSFLTESLRTAVSGCSHPGTCTPPVFSRRFLFTSFTEQDGANTFGCRDRATNVGSCSSCLPMVVREENLLEENLLLAQQSTEEPEDQPGRTLHPHCGLGGLRQIDGECSAVQCSAVQCSAVQCSAVQCSAVQCSAVLWCAVQCSAVECSAVLCSAVQCSAVQCSAVQCSAVQWSAVQCSAVQYDNITVNNSWWGVGGPQPSN